MGWSFSISIMDLYTSTHNENVERLGLYATMWLSTDTVPADAPPLGTYRTVLRADTKPRWPKAVRRRHEKR